MNTCLSSFPAPAVRSQVSGRFLHNLWKGICAALIAGLLAPTPVLATLTLEIINDSGKPDTDMYMLITGKPFTGGVSGSPIVSPESVLLNLDASSPTKPFVAISTLAPELPATPDTLISPYTGKSRPIYKIDVTSVGSGGIYFSYGPMTYGPAPAPETSTTRFDLMELSYNPGKDSVADTTTIDAFGIPIQIELIDEAGNPTDGLYVYRNTQTWIDAWTANNFGSAVLGIQTDKNPNKLVRSWDKVTDFVRILGPTKIGSLNGSPSNITPYSDFTGYMESLVTANYTFVINGQGNGSSYINYQGSIARDGADGYTITLAPPNPLAGGGIFPAPTAPTGNVPPTNATVTIHFPKDALNENIYGAPLNSSVFSVSGYTITSSNIVYGAMVADVLSALNFGFLNGIYGDDGGRWYSKVDLTLPYGNARNPNDNDGFYNPWAALVYNYSDAYGFAFSDRNTPEPTVDLYDNATLRITLLPDERLNSPDVTVKNVTDTSMELQWPAVKNATSYEVEVHTPRPGQSISVPLSSNAKEYSYTINSLNKGTAYTVSVKALGSANGNTLTTPARKQVIVTTGTPTYVPSTLEVPFQITFNSADTSNLPPTGGTFKLIDPGNATDPRQETDPIAYNATAATVKSAIEAKLTTNFSTVDVIGGAGGPWTVTQASTGAVPTSFQFDSSLTPLSGVDIEVVSGGSSTLKQQQTIRLGQYQLKKVEINGIEMVHGSSGSWQTPASAPVPGIPARVSGAFNTDNNYLVKVTDVNDTVVFDNVLDVRLKSSSGGQVEVESASLAGAFPISFSTNPSTISSPVSFTLGITYTPKGLRKSHEVKPPGSAPSFTEWIVETADSDIGVSPYEDPDMDGKVNLEEYFVGSDVDDADEVLWENPEGFHSTDGHFYFDYRKSKNLHGVIDRVFWSTDLVNWTQEGIVRYQDWDQGTFWQRTVSIPVTDKPKVFMRLEITQP